MVGNKEVASTIINIITLTNMEYGLKEKKEWLHQDYLNRTGNGYQSKAGMVVGIFLLTTAILMELLK